MTTERAIELLNRISDSQFDGIHGDERREALEMAVRALEGDGDTISRKMAIDAINNCYCGGEDSCGEPWIYEDDAIKAVEQLPSAQSETHDKRTETHACDLINRQQAIDAVKGLPTWWADGGGYYGGAQPPMVALLDPEDAVSAIENLPSAQPEVLACRSGELVQESDDLVKDLVKDCISRQAAIDAVSKWFYDVCSITESDGTATIFKRLRDLPSARTERKKGKWITVLGRLGNEVECNQCHSVFWYWMGNYRFCPSCGADMRGESDEMQ